MNWKCTICNSSFVVQMAVLKNIMPALSDWSSPIGLYYYSTRSYQIQTKEFIALFDAANAFFFRSSSIASHCILLLKLLQASCNLTTYLREFARRTTRYKIVWRGLLQTCNFTSITDSTRRRPEILSSDLIKMPLAS